MNFSEFPAGGSQNKKRQLQIQGPRPPPLGVRKESHKIKKPPKPPLAHRDLSPVFNPREPVVIYAVSPKVVHTTVSEFMAVVQRLTGISSGVFSSCSGDVSPAARLAATEKASPREKDLSRNDQDVVKEDAMEIVEEREAVELGGHHVPGILSPSPEMLLTVPAGLFSPASDPSKLMSPFFVGNSFVASPGCWPTNTNNISIVSPTLSPDTFGHLWDF